MSIYRRIEDICDSVLCWFWRVFIFIHETKNIFKKRKLLKDIKLTNEQKNEINCLWEKNYGKKIPHWWHRLYQSYTGEFDVNYFPEYIYSTNIEPFANQRFIVRTLGDKNLLDVLFDKKPNIDVRTPLTILSMVNGNFFNGNRIPISKSHANELLENIGEVIIKITIDSNSGKGVKLFDIKNGIDQKSKLTVDNILKMMGPNLIVQERLVAHEAFSTIYPHSINTIRIVTYSLENEIFSAPLTMRIGQGGNYIDNAHAGGMFIGVSDEGCLASEAFTEYQKRYKKHPDTGIIFDGYKIPYVREMIDSAKKLHSILPQCMFLSWDFMVDKNGSLVLIEVNIESQTIWFPQMANGRSFFGDNTEKMINISRRLRNGRENNI